MSDQAATDSEDLNRAEIDAALTGSPFAGRMHWFRTIDSTNTHALEEARLGTPHGSFYVADEQMAGRGRSDHSWHSGVGEGLYLSVLLRPDMAAADLVWLPLLTGLAVHRAIREVTALTTDLRWPKDVLIESRKVAGILVEAQSESGRATAAVVGIGVNLHQRSFPAGLSTPATSLDLESGRWVSRQELLLAVLLALHDELAVLDAARDRDATLAAIPGRIAEASTWVKGRRVNVHGPQPCSGVTEGLDARGFLLVRTTDGVVTVMTGGIRKAID